MDKSAMKVEKCKVRSCEVCGLIRIPQASRHDDENYEGEPGVRITTTENTKEDWNNQPKETETQVCQLCMDNMIHLHAVVVGNKLSSASKVEPRYITAIEPDPEKEL
jgi:hypothetical protein